MCVSIFGVSNTDPAEYPKRHVETLHVNRTPLSRDEKEEQMHWAVQQHIHYSSAQSTYQMVKQIHVAINTPTIALSLVFFRWIASMIRLTAGRFPAQNTTIPPSNPAESADQQRVKSAAGRIT